MIEAYEEDRSDYLANLLGALAIGVSDLQDRAMAELGRPRADLEGLIAAHARPGSTVHEIALAVGLTHSGAVRVIDRLASLGWVTRAQGTDRRTVSVHCTPLGHETARAALALRRRTLRNVVGRLLPEDRSALTRIAEQILTPLPRARADAWRICRLCDHDVCGPEVCHVGKSVP